MPHDTTADDVDTSENHTESADNLVRRLAARYLIVLALVAVLMVFDQAVVQPLLLRLDAYAPAINLAGRQRMLSQKLTKAALAFQAGSDEATRNKCHAEIRQTLDHWTAAQEALLNRDQRLDIRTIQSPEIAAEWNVLLPHFNAMRSAADKLINFTEANSLEGNTKQAVDQIAAHEAEFLSAMDRIVSLMELKAANEINRLRAYALAIASLVILLLLGLGWYVVRPATRTIRRQVDDLESRIAQRTRELANALISLRQQIAERTEVESRNKVLAARLSHADRVASMGHLSVSLAHELNQPLGAIANYAEVCDVIVSQPAASSGHTRLQENLSQIKLAALRAGQIIRRIRNFVQPGSGTVDDVDINTLVREVAALCRQEIVQAEVELTLDLSADDGVVSVDSIQIQQVLVNLIQNAMQAMQSCSAGKRCLQIRTSRTLDAVRVDILDSGQGITAEDADRIFDPFHTSKEDGLGVGLAICRSIVENYDGTIWAESKSGFGAQLSFTLPLARPHADCPTIESDCVCG